CSPLPRPYVLDAAARRDPISSGALCPAVAKGRLQGGCDSVLGYVDESARLDHCPDTAYVWARITVRVPISSYAVVDTVIDAPHFHERGCLPRWVDSRS